MRMTAAIATAPKAPFVVDEVEIDAPRPGEVLVRMAGAGICHTDLISRDQAFPVPLPAVLGHEGAGVVEQVGEGVTTVSPGDHVVLTYDSCGTCRSCADGKSARCRNFLRHNFAASRIDGTSPLRWGQNPLSGWFFGQSSLATHAITSARNTIAVNKEAPLHLLGPMGCGIQTGAGTVLSGLRCEPGSSIAVFGAGSVGCAAILGAKVAGCTEIIAVSRNAARLELALRMGATHVVQSGVDGEDPVAAIRSITGGGADYTLDTTAVPSVFRQALDALDEGGVCAHVGVAAPGTEVKVDLYDLLFSRQIRGVVEGDANPGSFIPALVDLHVQGRFPFEKMITTYPLSEINAAIEETEHRVTPKAVIAFD